MATLKVQIVMTMLRTTMIIEMITTMLLMLIMIMATTKMMLQLEKLLLVLMRTAKIILIGRVMAEIPSYEELLSDMKVTKETELDVYR